MLPPTKTRDLARRLVREAAEASTMAAQPEPATVRIYERLRQQLSGTVGVAGFQMLASRALTLAKSESPRLEAVRVTAEGTLVGLDECDPGVGFIAQLLGLFLTFLGEATTLRLIEDMRVQANDVQANVKREPATTAGDVIASANGPAAAAAFEDLLGEIDRLRNVSNSIEALAEKHPGMEDGLVSVAGNIRSIATVLEVFTLIKSKAVSSQEDAPDPAKNSYVN